MEMNEIAVKCLGLSLDEFRSMTPDEKFELLEKNRDKRSSKVKLKKFYQKPLRSSDFTDRAKEIAKEIPRG